MSAKDIWYGMLEAGEKSSPVVLDYTIDTSNNKIYLYNYVRNQFIEYVKTIVEPKLRELAAGNISRDELDKAFKAARQAFSSAHKASARSDAQKPAAPGVKVEDDDIPELDLADDDDMEDFIDDD